MTTPGRAALVEAAAAESARVYGRLFREDEHARPVVEVAEPARASAGRHPSGLPAPGPGLRVLLESVRAGLSNAEILTRFPAATYPQVQAARKRAMKGAA